MNILHIVTTISILAILYLVLKLTRKVHTMERSQKNIDLSDNNMSRKQVYSQSWYDDYDRDSHRYRGSGHSSSATQSSRRGERTASSSGIDESKPAPHAVIYQSEFDYISRCILDYPDIETGGQLFGFLTEYGVPVVCYAIGPGPRANHQVAFFNQDTSYLQSFYNEVSRKYGLRYIGEWHSHHQLGLAKPSGHDASTIVNGINRSHFRHFLLCIGNCNNQGTRSSLNAFTFHINNPYSYSHVPWKIINIESPYRNIVDRDLRNMVRHPQTPYASHGDNYIITSARTPVAVVPNYSGEYWLNSKANNLILKQIIDYLAAIHNTSVKPQIDAEKHVHLIINSANGNEEITFGEQFPNEAPIIKNIDNGEIENCQWLYDGDIYNSFVKFYEKKKIGPKPADESEPISNETHYW